MWSRFRLTHHGHPYQFSIQKQGEGPEAFKPVYQNAGKAARIVDPVANVVLSGIPFLIDRVETGNGAIMIYPDLTEAAEIVQDVLANPTPRTIDRFKVKLIEGEQGFAPSEWVQVGGVWRCASSTKDAYARLAFWDLLLHELYHREDRRQQPEKFENYILHWAEIEIPAYACTEAVQGLRHERFPHLKRGSVRLCNRIGCGEQIGEFTPPAEEASRARFIADYCRQFQQYEQDIGSLAPEQLNLLLLGPPDFLECIGEEERRIIFG